MRMRGFTILEILIVISVVAILMGIAIPRLKGMRDEGNVIKARRELKTLQAAVESYRMNHQNVNPSNITTDLTGAYPQMIASPLADPFKANAGTYKYSTSGKFYAISSVGPGGANETGTVQPMGNVPTGGDDLLVTNGAASTLDVNTDTYNCGTLDHACSGADTCSAGTCQNCGTNSAGTMCCTNGETACVGGSIGATCCAAGLVCGSNERNVGCCASGETACLGIWSGAVCCTSDQTCGYNDHTPICCGPGQTPCMGAYGGAVCCSGGESCSAGAWDASCIPP